MTCHYSCFARDIPKFNCLMLQFIGHWSSAVSSTVALLSICRTHMVQCANFHIFIHLEGHNIKERQKTLRQQQKTIKNRDGLIKFFLYSWC